MKKFKIRKILKISLICIGLLIVLEVLKLTFLYYLYEMKDPAIPKCTYIEYFNKSISNDIIQIDQKESKNKLFTFYSYASKYNLVIWEFYNTNISRKIHYHKSFYNNYDELPFDNSTKFNYSVGDYTGYAFQNNLKTNYQSDLYFSFYKNGKIISKTITPKYYSINYLSNCLTIGSSIEKHDLTIVTTEMIKTNLVILNRKGKLVFIFASAKNGVEPIKDDFLLDILKPSLLTEGLH